MEKSEISWILNSVYRNKEQSNRYPKKQKQVTMGQCLLLGNLGKCPNVP